MKYMTPEEITEMHNAAVQIAEVLKVPVQYTEPDPPCYPAGYFLIGDPKHGRPLPPDGAVALADLLNTLGIKSAFGVMIGHAADCVEVFGSAFKSPEDRAKNLAAIAAHKDELRQAKQTVNIANQVFRDEMEALRRSGGYLIDPNKKESFNPSR